MQILELIKSKVASEDDMISLASSWRREGKSIVFTNGVFDIIHKGHITLLAQAAAFGNKLIIGLNSDASVRTLGKGPDRPINGESDRAFVLAALGMVDMVVIFDTPTPYELIEKIQPDVLVKGGDYSAEQVNQSAKDYIVGSDLQRAAGRQTRVISTVEGYSTTATAKKLADGKN
jgi:rfaE bifunctional protein nucleotidyltransferase chain/domain